MSQGSEAKKYNPFDEMEKELADVSPIGRQAVEIRREASHQASSQGEVDEITKQDAAGRDIAIKRLRGTDKTVHTFTMRATVRSTNRFATWCERHRLSYREGFDLLIPFVDNIKL